MKKLLGIILFTLLLSPAFAADNAVVVTPGTGVTMRSKDIGLGVQSMVHILGDTSGNPIYGTAGTANANILTVQGIASMTPFLVTLSGTNNVTNAGTFAVQANGFTSWAGGTLGAMANYGTSPGAVLVPGVNAFITNTPAVSQSGSPWGVSAIASGFADGWDVTEGTKADSAWVSGSGSLIAIAKTIANNTAAAIPAGTAVIGFTSNDPCSQGTKLGAAINLTASGQVITGAAAKKTYICSLDLVSATGQNIALVEGTGSTCATNIFGLAGGTTAATGWNLAANGGLTKGSGTGTVYSPSADTNGTAANICLLLSSTGQTSGQITYVQQ